MPWRPRYAASSKSPSSSAGLGAPAWRRPRGSPLRGRRLRAGARGGRARRLRARRAPHPHGHPQGELAAARRADHLDAGERGSADLGLEQAAVERLEPHAPHQRPARTSARPSSGTRARSTAAEGGETPPSPRAGGPAWASRRRRASARPAQRDAARRCAAGTRSRTFRFMTVAAHRSTSGRSCARRAGPIPGTASSSSTD